MFEYRFNAPQVALHPKDTSDSKTFHWTILPSGEDEPCGELRYNAVSGLCEIQIDADHRGNGFATQALTAWLPSVLVERSVSVQVRTSHVASAALARRVGFEPSNENGIWSVRNAFAANQLRQGWTEKFEARAQEALREVALTPEYVLNRQLPLYPEARQLAALPADRYGRVPWLRPDATEAWMKMQVTAAQAGVAMDLISAFRSYGYQRGLVKRKLAADQTIDDIYCVTAPPGYSEHHTGCAVDIGVPHQEPLMEDFEDSAAFKWLTEQAKNFGFSLTYPKDNAQGMLYEPWHWRFHGDD